MMTMKLMKLVKNKQINRVIEAKYIKDYTLFLRFFDGSEGEIDFEQELDGEIFEPLKDVSYFKHET